MPETAPTPFEPELPGEVAARRSGLRTGWTTGTCATAAAKAAALGLVSGQVPDEIEIGLPNGDRARFSVEHDVAVPAGGPAVAVVVKDAGDDPDCTNGARMTATVHFRNESAADHELIAGDGVGTVTKPGLGLPVGAPAINPVPRSMILAALDEVPGLGGSGGRFLRVEFSVPGGVEMAAETTNDRLGILGGISILGTSGIVRPFSTAAYRASVLQQVNVAAAQGERQMVFCTGARTERVATTLFALDPVCFVEVGDFTGIALRRCVATSMEAAAVVAMAGKITKLAAGIMMTHWHRSAVDTELLELVAVETAAPPSVTAAATETATARHFFEVCVAANFLAPLERLCQMAAATCRTHTSGKLAIEVLMADFEGERIVARG